MAMSGNTPPIGGPGYTPKMTRPSTAAGLPAQNDSHRTEDMVNLGPGTFAPTHGKAASAPETPLLPRDIEPKTQSHQTPASNVPTVLTVGDLGGPSCDYPELGLNGPSRPSHIETLGTRQDRSFGGQEVLAGQKPFDN